MYTQNENYMIMLYNIVVTNSILLFLYNNYNIIAIILYFW